MGIPNIPLVETPRDQEEVQEAAKFETAIEATEFGKFNYCLLLIAFLGGWPNPFEVTTMSYVFPVAQCDLNLSLRDKGLINASPYFGNIFGGLLWGFFCDIFGRRKVIIITYLLDAASVAASGFSMNLPMVLVSKFLGGFFAIGAFSALVAYMAEFHSKKYRAKVQLYQGFTFNCGLIMLPLLAWTILPLKIHVHLYFLVLHSWNIYLFICAIPALVSGIIYYFMPETPKFLMTMDCNEKAVEVFQKMFALNTGKSKDEFPFKTLIEEARLIKSERVNTSWTDVATRSSIQSIRKGCQQIRSIFRPPYIKYFILVCTIQPLNMLSIQTLRLWLPQIFQFINKYQYNQNTSSASICDMVTMIDDSSCETDHLDFFPTVYLYSVIIASVSSMGCLSVMLFINKLNKKILLSFTLLLSGIFGILYYFAQNIVMVVIFSAIFQTAGAVSLNVMLLITVEFFPTALRAVAISSVVVMGRFYAMLGNIIFPFLLEAGCAPPFVVIGSLPIVSLLLLIFLPYSEKKELV